MANVTYNQVVRKRGWLTREIKAAQDLLNSTSDLDAYDYETALVSLTNRWDKYDEIYVEFSDIGKEDEVVKEDGERNKKHAEVSQTKMELRQKISQVNSKTTPTPTPLQGVPPTTLPTPKMPIIQIPEFGGKIEEWESFWDVYNTLVHTNNNISTIVKFTYLRGSLTGKAKEALKGFKTTDADYAEAIDYLVKTFADKKKVKRLITRKLIDIKKPHVNYNSILNFKHEVETCIRVLKTYEDVEGSEWLIVEIVHNQLPLELEKYIVQRYKTEYPGLKEIMEGIGLFLDWIEHSKEFKNRTDDLGPVMLSKKDTTAHNPNNSKKSIGSYNTAVSGTTCIFCHMTNHVSAKCRKISSVKDRKAKLRELNRCFKCTKAGHFAGDCRVKLFCDLCKVTGHHTILCLGKQGNIKPHKSESNSSVGPNKDDSNQISQNVVTATSLHKKVVKSPLPSCVLPTATVIVSNPKTNDAVECRGFWDQGSQCSFITKQLADRLGLNVLDEVRVGISAFRSEPREDLFKVTTVVVRMGKRFARLKLLIVDDLPLHLHSPGLFQASRILGNAGFRLADHNITSDIVDNIDLVIGALHFSKFINGFKKWEGYDLMTSPAGVLIYGELPGAPTNISRNVYNVTVMRIATTFPPSEISSIADEGIESVHKLWDLESVGIKSTEENTHDENRVYKNYLKTVKYVNDKYMVQLPWKDNHPPLPTNYRKARGQLMSLLTTLSKDPDKFSVYDKVIKEQLELGFIEKVNEVFPLQENCHYLPHHGIVKDSITTPLRVVFNCSSKDKNGVSLNDCLYTGPSLTEKLCNILLKFRTEKYAYTADISKAFLRVGLQEQDRDYTRFLWIDNIEDKTPKVVVYRFKVVMFGATSSPFLLQATIENHLRDSQSPLAKDIMNQFYMDNLQGTTSNVDHLLNIFNEANVELAKANMPLQSWHTNNAVLQQQITEYYPYEERQQKISVLGLVWDIDDDLLLVNPAKFQEKCLTKRTLLSLVSQTFDPLGLLAPLVIRGKLLIQKAWKLKLGWDERLPEQFSKDWAYLKEDLHLVGDFKFPRSVSNNNEICHLHVFCDASQKAYGAVAYIVSLKDSNILMSKTKVAPLSTRTLPQLELTALYIGANLIDFLMDKFPVKFATVTLWTDSKVTLNWLKSDNSEIVYVKNRVAEINRCCERYGVSLAYVKSNENPADLLSRGVSAKVLKQSDLWFKGPLWLINAPVPLNVDLLTVNEITTDFPSLSVPDPLFELEKFSSLSKVLGITTLILKYVRKLKPCNSLPLGAVSYWVKTEQSIFYPGIKMVLLKQGKVTGLGNSKQMIKQLGLFLDESGFIRCKGRLEHSQLSYNAKHPVLLSPKSYFTKLIIQHTHELCAHGGVGLTLRYLRMEFWLPKGRQSVHSVISRCLHCRRVCGAAYSYPGPPPLPLERVNLTVPFKTTGVDYTGDITLSKGISGNVKRYVCLFTCASTRAVHLGLARDLSAETFLKLFRRFVSRFSLPSLMISDNASNFTATAKFLRELSDEPSIKQFLQSNKVDWQFIAPRAPWQGGFYERLIGIVKGCLHKVLFKRKIDEDELLTVLMEIEAHINNRPLTYLHADLNNEEVLTPSLLLYGRNIRLSPPLIDDCADDLPYNESSVLRQSYVNLCKIIEKFKSMWQKDYLVALREKHYGQQNAVSKNNISIGDVVLVQAEGFRDFWPLGKIVNLVPGSDGITRSVEVLSKGKITVKTIDKLIPLEADLVSSDDNDEIGTLTESASPEEELKRRDRPRRKAAIRAGDLRSHLIKQNLI